MKLFKTRIFSIFGMALLATGFVACSSDDNATTENENVEQANYLKSLKQNSNEINLIVEAFSETIDAKVQDDNLSDDDLGYIFLDIARSKNIKIQDPSELKDINLGNEFLNYAENIGNTNFDTHTEYFLHLNELEVSINRSSNLSFEEKKILSNQIVFSIASLQMLYEKDIKLNNKSLSFNTTYGKGKSWWNSWGKCAAGIIGGGITGGTVGCAGIGGLGAVVGAAAGLGVGSVPGAVIGGVAGCVAGGVAGWVGGALTGAAMFCD